MTRINLPASFYHPSLPQVETEKEKKIIAFQPTNLVSHFFSDLGSTVSVSHPD